MVAAARAHLPESASTILRHIVTEADRFAAAAPQHDDMTLLLMKLDHAPRLTHRLIAVRSLASSIVSLSEAKDPQFARSATRVR